MTVLNFAEISLRFAQRQRFKDYPIEGLGSIRVRMMPAVVAQPLYAESSQFFEQHGKDVKSWPPEAHRRMIEVSAKLIQAATVDGSGGPLFPGDDGWQLLMSLDTDVLMTLRDAVQDFNGLQEPEEDTDEGN